LPHGGNSNRPSVRDWQFAVHGDRMKSRLAFLAAVALVQIGCSSLWTSGPLYERPIQSTKIAMASYNVTINDHRSSFSNQPGTISIPGLLGFGGPDFVSPPLDSEFEARARQVIEGCQAPGSRDLVFTVDIFIGRQRLWHDILYNTETVQWDLKVQVFEKGGQVSGPTAVEELWGNSWGERMSRHTRPERLHEMFLDSFAQALQDALSHVSEPRKGG
jgi:hypothetical protein